MSENAPGKARPGRQQRVTPRHAATPFGGRSCGRISGRPGSSRAEAAEAAAQHHHHPINLADRDSANRVRAPTGTAAWACCLGFTTSSYPILLAYPRDGGPETSA